MAEVRANFDLRFRVADDSEVSRARSFAQDRIDALLLQTLPLRDAGLLGKASQTESRSWSVFNTVMAAALILPMLGLKVLTGAHWGRITVAAFFSSPYSA
ncbi:hypothetical protein [Mangrovihabitans endophyticus]|uniref:Uncharacterized protein n=1 Tax=Mangrovihabitans endophyticus TaxID=1751298 RepID=A0A8J3FRL7_9ACTN|nr:hypothetical protein [Mangrovihabitans endophyticus]GGL17124.1 hypothetical protein GCM10012284_59640 [Mangrovihabitans endophyticus]